VQPLGQSGRMEEPGVHVEGLQAGPGLQVRSDDVAPLWVVEAQLVSGDRGGDGRRSRDADL
jgi:hypothetical protein